jgi:hypothetical protein
LRLYRAFGTVSLAPVPRPGRQPPAGLVLRPDEEAVRRAADGRRTVLEIARVCDVGEVDALAVLYGLAVLGLMEPPAGRRRGPLPPLGPDAVARAGAPRTADQMPGFSELVAERHVVCRTADYFQVLGVPRSATGAEVRAAWERLRRQFDPHRVRRDGPLWHPVQEIADVLDDAYAMLSDPRRRSLYERNLE